MLFNSFNFILIYLPIIFSLTFLLAKLNKTIALSFLGFASLVFYSIWNMPFVLLLLGSIIVNYLSGYFISLSKIQTSKRTILILAISLNLILLCYYKYVNFFIEISNSLLKQHMVEFNILLPLGISFFTFTQIAFLVDTYKGITKERNLIYYLLFVTYFPHLIAGPILHHKQMIPQFAKKDIFNFNLQNFCIGLTFFIFGLSKKILLADNLSRYVNPIFNAAQNGNNLTFGSGWIGGLTYTLQLYFDFSGYSDMAIGLSLLFNIRLPLNFYSPYKSASIIEFWRKWHMTLSTFLKDYLYIPIGGSHCGSMRHYLNIMITMILGGMWHGAGWTFIAWGVLHGIYIVINHICRDIAFFQRNILKNNYIRNLLSILVTMMSIVIAWVIFRANSIKSAIYMLGNMFGFNGLSFHSNDLYNSKIAIIFVFIGFFIVWFMPNTYQILYKFNPICDAQKTEKQIQFRSSFINWRLKYPFAIIIGLLLFMCFSSMLSNTPSEFLYFQF